MIYKIKVVCCSGWSEISGLEPSLLDLPVWGNFKIFIIQAYKLREHKQPPFIVRVRGGMQLMSIEMQVPSPDFPEAHYTSKFLSPSHRRQFFSQVYEFRVGLSFPMPPPPTNFTKSILPCNPQPYPEKTATFHNTTTDFFAK